MEGLFVSTKRNLPTSLFKWQTNTAPWKLPATSRHWVFTFLPGTAISLASPEPWDLAWVALWFVSMVTAVSYSEHLSYSCIVKMAFKINNASGTLGMGPFKSLGEAARHYNNIMYRLRSWRGQLWVQSQQVPGYPGLHSKTLSEEQTRKQRWGEANHTALMYVG